MTGDFTEKQALAVIPPEELERAKEFRPEWHWGFPTDRPFPITKWEAPAGVVGLGMLRMVAYQTSAGNGTEEWILKTFKPKGKDSPFPMLCCDPEGKQLFVFGGTPGRKAMAERMSEEEARSLIDPLEFEKALEFREKFHWGLPADKLFRIGGWTTPKNAFALGWLRLIGYQTNKRGDGKDMWYVHSFPPSTKSKDGNPFPMLCWNPEAKQWVIAGGDYTIEDKGIVG